MIEVVWLSGEMQGLMAGWMREFQACKLVREEAGGEWRRDSEWLYGNAWCDERAIGNVAMANASRLLAAG